MTSLNWKYFTRTERDIPSAREFMWLVGQQDHTKTTGGISMKFEWRLGLHQEETPFTF